ncbi:ATP-dependent DNA helicase Hel308 [uncultured archaeon]|nr:ATP-dependent DNA helicase Hel308 [uncultured archaeon]
MVAYVKVPDSDEAIIAELDPLVARWFKGRFTSFAPPQRYTILPIHRGENILVSAPTGSGKTLTAFLAVLNELIKQSKAGKLEDKVYCLYVSPLKALNNDIKRNLLEPLSEMEGISGRDLGIRVMVRTGDTSEAERARMRETPPHILITTPESLSIMLVSPRFKEHLRDIKWVVVDEIHALAESKRGVDLSLSLERLQEHAGRFCRVGLSATISPLPKIAEYLAGYEAGKPRDCHVVDVQAFKQLDLKVLSPVKDLINTSQTELQDAMYNLIDDLIQKHRTTLIFTNTRAGTERLVIELKKRFPENYKDNIGAHHGSLAAEHRQNIEEQLKNGELKVVVSSTSLELGIDIGYIDLVILLGSPKSVARALQRTGRSGHRLHDVSKGRIVVLDRDDLVECAVLLKCALEGVLDEIDIPERSLDVLAQHLYGIAIEDRKYVDNVFDMVKRSFCYRNLSREEFDSVMSYLSGGYVDLEERRVYAKIWWDQDTGMMGKRGKMARPILSQNIGTIPEESYITVKVGERKVGEVDEGFISRLKKGDIFVLGGNLYRFNYSRGMTMQVTESDGPPTVPTWVSEMLPLSYGLAKEIQKFRRLMNERMDDPKADVMKFLSTYLYVDEYAREAIYWYFREQYKYAKIPHDRKIIVEYYEGFGQRYVVFHTLFGRRVNDVLSRALAYLVSKRQGKDVLIGLSDNGFYLSGKGKMQIQQAFDDLKESNLRLVLERAIDKTDVLVRRFRHCATRALMILRSYRGTRMSTGRQQVGSKILLRYIQRLNPDFSILREARREVLEDLMDVRHAAEVVEGLRSGRITVETIDTDVPSPFALSLVARGYMDAVKMEDRLDFIRRMHEATIVRISRKGGL